MRDKSRPSWPPSCESKQALAALRSGRPPATEIAVGMVLALFYMKGQS
jgi:hypothetical protein